MDDRKSDPPLTRREALRGFAVGGLGAAGLLGAAQTLANQDDSAATTISSTPVRDGQPIDFESARDNLTAYIKLIGDSSGRNIVGHYSGHVYAVEGGELVRPLFGFEGFGTGRYEPQPDGSYRNIWREVGYYKDLVTGKILEQWTNPWSGETLDVLPVQNDPVNFVLTDRIPQVPIREGLEFRFGNYGRGEAFILPWFFDRAGDWAEIMYDVHGRRPNPLPPDEWPRESSGKSLRTSEFFQMGGRLSQLENPSVTNVWQVGGWQRIGEWLPWMVMDQRSGHLMYRAVTRKYTRVEDLPRQILDYTERHFSKFLTPPEKWEARNMSSFDVYKATRKPLPPKS